MRPLTLVCLGAVAWLLSSAGCSSAKSGGSGGAAGSGGIGGMVEGTGGAAGSGGKMDASPDLAGTGEGGGGGISGSGGGGGTGGGGNAGGGNAGGGTGGGGIGGTGGGAGGAGHDDCHGDADCTAIGCPTPPCSDVLCSLGADGFHHCEKRAHPPLNACPNPNPNPAVPCCKADAECTKSPRGRCIPLAEDFCGGAPPLASNSCRYDECTADSDCTAMPNGLCTARYPRACVYGPCRSNTDCTRSPGGRCVIGVVTYPCSRRVALCRYPNDPCVVDSDCHGDPGAYGLLCVPNPDSHGTKCQMKGPPPP
jgi:hypothetical protein